MPADTRAVSMLVGFLLVVSALVAGQTATTSLRGTIVDPNGAVVQGATVTLKPGGRVHADREIWW